jgi:hypothetical protein
MTDATPYLWLADSHRAQLRDRYVKATNAWNSRWLKPSVSIFSEALGLARNSDMPESAIGEMWSLENGSRCYVIVEFGATGSFQALFDRIVAAPTRAGRPRQSSPVAIDVTQSLLSDWVLEFMGATAGEQRTPVWRNIDATTRDEVLGNAALRMTLQIGGVEVNMLVPGTNVRQLLTRPTMKATSGLTPVLQAATTTAVRLRVSLDASDSLTLEALENLSKGDIVLLDREAVDHWTLTGPDGTAVASCAPGHIGSHYAVQVLGPS